MNECEYFSDNYIERSIWCGDLWRYKLKFVFPSAVNGIMSTICMFSVFSQIIDKVSPRTRRKLEEMSNKKRGKKLLLAFSIERTRTSEETNQTEIARPKRERKISHFFHSSTLMCDSTQAQNTISSPVAPEFDDFRCSVAKLQQRI